MSRLRKLIPLPEGTCRRRPSRCLSTCGLHFAPPGAIAQLGERLDRTQEVGGSSPPSSTPPRLALPARFREGRSMRRIGLAGVVLAAFAVGAPAARAQIPLTAPDQPYAQSFNGLAASGSSTALPSGWTLTESGAAPNDELHRRRRHERHRRHVQLRRRHGDRPRARHPPRRQRLPRPSARGSPTPRAGRSPG